MRSDFASDHLPSTWTLTAEASAHPPRGNNTLFSFKEDKEGDWIRAFCQKLLDFRIPTPTPPTVDQLSHTIERFHEALHEASINTQGAKLDILYVKTVLKLFR